MFIIGLHSHKQGGKNYLAEVFAKRYQYEYNIQLLSFAHDMKKFLSELLEVNIEDFEDGAGKELLRDFKFSIHKMAAIMYHNSYAPYSMCEQLAMQVVNELWLLESTGFHDEHDNVSVRTNYRSMLRALGQTMRKFDEHFWVKRAQKHIRQESDVVILTDVRMENEASICDMVVRIHTNNKEYDNHITEKPLPSKLVHFNVTNDYSHGWAVLNAKYIDLEMHNIRRGAL